MTTPTTAAPTTAGGLATHFVLTRFNVRMPHYAHADESWLPARVRLFDAYCLPTFRAQTERAFHWLVFADADSPDWLREQLEERLAGLGEVVYVDGVFTDATAAAAVRVRTSTPYVITTRVDNDDAIADDFIATIQSQFAEQELELVNLVNGAQYSKRRVYLRPYTRNPFISLVERVGPGGPRTVFVRRHYELDQVGPIRNVKTAHPAWLQVVHGENVLTELVGLRARPTRVSPFFSCALDLDRSLPGYLVETAQGGVRIGWRLVRKPKRVLDLAQTLLARRASGD